MKKERDDSYDILIGAGVSKQVPKDLKAKPVGERYAVITDSNVRRLFGKEVVEGLEDEGLEVCLIDFPAGEESKSLKTLEYLTRKMICNGLDRRSAVIALGGGTVGDVAGFTAATYMRGIPYIQIPTTLIAQVDSSVGGKTAVNLPEGKNLIGLFYQPSRVYIDPLMLLTLPKRHIRNGVAEIVKYGVIYDGSLFDYLERSVEKVEALDLDALTYIILRSCRIKSEVVQKDEREENLRSILNYGHTIGHAEERCGQYRGLLHGEAISIGMNYAGCLAVRKGLWSEEDLRRQNRLIQSYGLPLNTRCDPMELVKIIRYDKKAEEGRIMFVLPESIGRMATVRGKYRIPVSEEELLEVLHGSKPQKPRG